MKRFINNELDGKQIYICRQAASHLLACAFQFLPVTTAITMLTISAHIHSSKKYLEDHHKKSCQCVSSHIDLGPPVSLDWLKKQVSKLGSIKIEDSIRIHLKGEGKIVSLCYGSLYILLGRLFNLFPTTLEFNHQHLFETVEEQTGTHFKLDKRCASYGSFILEDVGEVLQNMDVKFVYNEMDKYCGTS